MTETFAKSDIREIYPDAQFTVGDMFRFQGFWWRIVKIDHDGLECVIL